MERVVTILLRAGDRDPLALRVAQARRELRRGRPSGRLWLNGRELGSPAPPVAQLALSHD